MKRVKRLFSAIIIAILLLGVFAPITLKVLAVNGSNDVSSIAENLNLPRVSVIKLWGITHKAYMAKFPNEDTVAVFGGHGDIRGNYISIVSSSSAYLYDIKTGELKLKVTADSDGDTFDLNGNKVWGRVGFFSADGSRMIEDVCRYGTNARVVRVGSWDTIPIDWGFTDTTSGHFYACQLDYSGATLAVGYISQGKLLVFKYDPVQNKYVKIFEHQESGNYGRRLHITLDGKYIVVGGLDYPYIDIWKWSSENETYIRVVHYQIPDSGGLGALGISDPYNVGYIVGGTENGWVIIAHYNVTTNEFKVIYEEKVAPDGSWIYNPFYDRWIPQVTEIFALCTHRDSDTIGRGIIYDVLTNQTITIDFAGAGSTQWSAAAVSPQANYVFLGNSLYIVVKRDIQSSNPRVRFWGSLECYKESYSLSDAIQFMSPTGDWHLYFYSGRVTINEVDVKPISLNLVDDSDIKEGRLSEMLNKGLVSGEAFRSENAEVTEFKLISGSEIKDALSKEGIGASENFVASASTTHFVPPQYFVEGSTWTGTTVHIPFNNSIYISDDLILYLKTSIHTSAVIYDSDNRALGIYGIPIELGDGIGIGAKTYSRIANRVLGLYASNHSVNIGTVPTTSQTPTRIYGIVGTAIAVWGGLDNVLADWGGLNEVNVQNWVILAPVIEDPQGNKYTAIQLILPLEEADNVENYYNIILNYFKDQGYVDVGYKVIYPSRTWEDYKELISGGYTPHIKLDELISDTIAAKYNLEVNKLRIRGIDIVTLTVVKAENSFWEWLATIGDAKMDVVTLIGSSGTVIKSILASRKITDPAEIAETVDKVIINGKEYNTMVGEDGAYVDFAFIFGTEKLVIDFGNKVGYYADIDIETKVLLKKEFEPLGDYGYTATINYDWGGMLIKIDRVEFVDMYYPMLKAEGIFANGDVINDLTNAFELTDVIDYNNSPSGKLYYYITVNNIELFDPLDVGVLEPNETFTFRYFYKEAPDARIEVYLDGIKTTSTLPHYVTVAINSTANQIITYELGVYVKYFEDGVENVSLSNTFTDTVYLTENETIYKIYDISEYIDKAIDFMRNQNITAYVEIIGKITQAEKDNYKENDEYRVIYCPSPLFPKDCTVNVTVYAYDVINGSGVANVTVVFEKGNLSWSVVTNDTGYAEISLPALGLYSISGSHSVYNAIPRRVQIYNNSTVITLPMVPTSASGIPLPPLNDSINAPIEINGTQYYWLSLQLLYSDGYPFYNANVSVIDVVGGTTIATGITDGAGLAYFLVPTNTTIEYTIDAYNPYLNETYHIESQLDMTQHYYLVHTTPWTSNFSTSEVFVKGVRFITHRGLGSFFGDVSHLAILTIWTNTPQTISVQLGVYYEDNDTWFVNKTDSITLSEGVNTIYKWISLNIAERGYYKVLANITSYESDTNIMNNEVWSNSVFLRPYVDIRVFVEWIAVEQKRPWALLPEDLVEIEIGIVIPTRTAENPVTLEWTIEKFDIEKKEYCVEQSGIDYIGAIEAGTAWRNITIEVPWSSRILVRANITHPWDDFGCNNHMELVIQIDPDVKIEIIDAPSMAIESYPIRFVVNVTSNVEAGGGVGWITLIDNKTGELVKWHEITLEPHKTITLEATAPLNPIMFWIVRSPTSWHEVTAQYAGYDLYLENNVANSSVRVVSYQWFLIFGILVIIVSILAIIEVVKDTIEDVRDKSRRFVRRKGFLKETIWDGENKRFVRKK